jgi:hypothetical protein
MKKAQSSANEGLEGFLKDLLWKLTEAAYKVALKTGFRGSFITFLSDLQEALEAVIAQDRQRARRPRSRAHTAAMH